MMTFLPIVDRELRVASRRRGTYWNRAITVGGSLLIFSWLLLGTQQLSRGQAGLILFWALGGMYLFVAAFSGLHHTADSLSEEKREGTLGLLFLTSLQGWDVIGGKLVATSVSAFYGLLAILPVLAIPLMMGGVTLAEFGRLSLVLVNTMFFSLAAGLLASSLARRARTAASLTFLFIFVAHVLMPLVGVIVAAQTDTQPRMGFFVGSAGFGCLAASARQYWTMVPQFWLSLGIVHLEAWLALLGASLVIRNSWREPATGLKRQSWRAKLALRLAGSPVQRTQGRRRLLDLNPCLWLSARHRHRPWMIWIVLGAVGLGWAYGAYRVTNWGNPGTYIFTAICLHLVLLLWLTSDAVQALGPDLRDRALELVLGTSLPVREMLAGHAEALWLRYRGPVLAVLGVDVVMMVAALPEVGLDDSGRWFLIWMLGILVWLLNLTASVWVGMWQSVKQRRLNRASSNTFAILVLLPWVAWGLSMTLLAWSSSLRGANVAEVVAYLLFTVLHVGANLVGWRWARSRLVEQLRFQVARRYGEGDKKKPS